MRDRLWRLVFVILLVLVGCGSPSSESNQTNRWPIENYEMYRDFRLFQENTVKNLNSLKDHQLVSGCQVRFNMMMDRYSSGGEVPFLDEASEVPELEEFVISLAQCADGSISSMRFYLDDFD